MGSIKIRKITYSGDMYYFESPELDDGINLIVGDNGSGKSTFSFFISYALGGTINCFKNNTNNKRRYLEIINDKNNYVLLNIDICEHSYVFKRFINNNDIFISDGVNNFSRKIKRVNDEETFSDWMLSKLDIDVFDLTLGKNSWKIGFNDLFRLMYYDQGTLPIKIFKSPDTENYITDSDVIRNAIFETLLGKTSDKYNRVYNSYQEKLLKYESAKQEVRLFCNLNNISQDVKFDLDGIVKDLETLELEFESIKIKRDESVIQETSFNDNLDFINEVKTNLLNTNVSINDMKIKKEQLLTEKYRVESFKSELKFEVEQLLKIIFINKKLNVFSPTTCPFCSKEIDDSKLGLCVCGNCKDDDGMEKFIYSSDDYLDIYKRKSKKIESINSALLSINEDIDTINSNITDKAKSLDLLTNDLSSIVENSVYSGNSNSIYMINIKLNHINDKICEKEKEYNIFSKLNNLLLNRERMDSDRAIAKELLNKEDYIFKKDKKDMVVNFNKIFKDLVNKSALSGAVVSIESDYMPIINGGTYTAKSAYVTIRLMYYYSMLLYGLIHGGIKFPMFLLIDTPEDSGIDLGHLIKNIKLIESTISSYTNDSSKYQVIITSGEDKYPDSFSKYKKITFNAKGNDFILKEKNV
jgi:hypothetical protein